MKGFGRKDGDAKNNYRDYVEKGTDKGRRPELVGGGLIRSLGGWLAVRAMRRSGDREMGDDRILGSGEFVEQIVKEAQANIRYQFSVKEHPGKIDEIIARECKNQKVSIKEFKAGGRRRAASRAQTRIALELVKAYGLPLAEVARQLGVTTSEVSRMISRAN